MIKEEFVKCRICGRYFWHKKVLRKPMKVCDGCLEMKDKTKRFLLIRQNI